jgi:hypothetical protein
LYSSRAIIRHYLHIPIPNRKIALRRSTFKHALKIDADESRESDFRDDSGDPYEETKPGRICQTIGEKNDHQKSVPDQRHPTTMMGNLLSSSTAIGIKKTCAF